MFLTKKVDDKKALNIVRLSISVIYLVNAFYWIHKGMNNPSFLRFFYLTSLFNISISFLVLIPIASIRIKRLSQLRIASYLGIIGSAVIFYKYINNIMATGPNLSALHIIMYSLIPIALLVMIEEKCKIK